jgi:outer membrane scaffolding protein for murein synthesis (MipA/OmpV family)
MTPVQPVSTLELKGFAQPGLRGFKLPAWPAVLLFIGLSTAGTAWADKPLWELGMGAGALRVPHYRGSDQTHDWTLPVPYLVYRGQILRSDREGTRAVLFDGERVDFDISAGASPPTRKGDNRARAGMPDLAATVEVGPNVNLMLGKGPGWKLDLRLPLRAVFTVTRSPQAIGWTSTPVLNLDLEVQGWNVGLQGGPLAATRRLHAYFYDVAPVYANSTRPAYAAAGGAAGWGLTASASRRLGNWWLAGFARTDSVSGSAFHDSPLVRQNRNITCGLAASYVFEVSKTRVADRL